MIQNAMGRRKLLQLGKYVRIDQIWVNHKLTVDFL